jgi:hypothetical protein
VFDSIHEEMMMNMRFSRQVLSVAALIVLGLPVASHADEQQAVNTCIRTFVNKVVPEGHPVEVQQESIRLPRYKVGEKRKIYLVAQGAESGKRYGRASCEVNAQGSLVAMYVGGSRVQLASNDMSTDRVGAR